MNNNSNPMASSESVDGGVLGGIIPSGLFDNIEKDKIDDKPDDKPKDDGLDNNDSKDDKPKDDDNKDDKPKGDGLEDDDKDDKPKDDDKPKADDKPKDDDVVTDSIISILGNEFPSLEGEFEDTEEGLVESVKVIAKAERTAGKEEGVNELYEELPVVKNVVEHLKQGGSLISLIQQQQVEDWSKVELEEENEADNEKTYRAFLEYKGFDEEEIEEFIGSAKDSKKLFEKAVKGKTFLVDVNKKVVEDRIKAEREAHLAELQEFKDLQDGIKAILKTNKIAGLDITPEVSRRLEEFTTKTDDKGNVARDAKWDSLTREQWLLLDLMVMDDFKPLVGKAIKVPSAKPVKLTIKKAKDTVNLNTSSKGGAGDVKSAVESFFNNNK